MNEHRPLSGIISGQPLNTFEQLLSELELGLTTVQDIIDRNADGGAAEESYIGINLGLYVTRTEQLLASCRQLVRSA